MRGGDLVPIFLCAWHVLKTWCLHSMDKIKDLEVKHATLERLHMVMFMSINPNETINDFKACGREMVMENFDNLQLKLLGQDTFGLIIANLVSKGSPFQVWHVLKPFCYGCITSCMFIFHMYSNYIMGWKYVVHVQEKLWMVGLHRVPHLNQDTQVSIKSYHGVLKHWFSLEAKGLKGCRID